MELIRELMQTQGMSIRKISAQIAQKHGGSALGYTQQINRILNDPTYDPTFATVEKVLAALNCSLWQTPTPLGATEVAVFPPESDRTHAIHQRLEYLSHEVAEMKLLLKALCVTVEQLTEQQTPVG